MAEAEFAATPDSALRVALIDAQNVRASMGWPPRERFYELARQWSRRAGDTLGVVVLDGGGPAQQVSRLDGSTLLCASGPRWSADDVLARDTSWWLQSPAVTSVLVITSDKRLKARCRHAARHTAASAATRLRIETSEAFAAWLAEPPCDAPVARARAQAAVASYIDYVALQPRPPNTNSGFVARRGAVALRR